MRNLTVENIAKAVNGELFTMDGGVADMSSTASDVVIDSRKASPNCVFIATRGERVDGHSFIGNVWKEDALVVIGEEDVSNKEFFPDGLKGNYIRVADSFVALKELAAYYRAGLDVKVVGITGSVGKTSTKEVVSYVLSARYNVVKTAGNFNNEVGVPLTLLSIRDEHEIAVVEMGISDFGEMTRLTNMVKPDVCLITNIGPCHLEFLGDLKGVLKAKSEIFISMAEDGYVCLNGDDEMLKTIENVKGKKPVTFGHEDSNDIYATDIESIGISGSRCRIHTPKGDFAAIIPLPGKHMVDNALAATAVGLVFDMTVEEIGEGLKTSRGISGRSNLIRTKEYLIVDDCYNANPKAMASAIDLIMNAKGRKVAILGDMFELGENSLAMHAEVGRYAVTKGIDFLICCGENSKYMYEEALTTHKEITGRENGKDVIKYYQNRELLERALKKEKLFIRDDNILIKASHGMGFEKLIDIIKEKSQG